jgi:glycosyltransferase involved in cell wall biosynthesis
MLACVDARIVSGYAGGVEMVLIGLARGLSRLEDSDEEYAFLTFRGHSKWLEPYVGGACRIVETAAPLSYRAGTRLPWARGIWRRLPVLPGMGVAPPPRSDGIAERLGAAVVHQVLQRGFLTQIPTIYNPHDLQHLHLPQFFTPRETATREARFRPLMAQAALVVVTSSWGRRDVIDHYDVAPDRVKVVPWAPILGEYPEPTPDDLVRVRDSYALPDRFILYPAQTWPHKNHRALLEALALLRDREGLDVTLVAPGYQTADFQALQRRTTELGLTDQVRWLGFVSTLDLRALYRLARAVVIPTRFEAASGPLWEAFQAGTAAACSNVTSLPDQAGDAALVFDPDRIDQIADAVRALWTDDALRTTLIQRGTANIERFSWDLTARMYRAWYRKLAGRVLSQADLALIEAPALL